jgi:hypothetical protein
MLFCFLKACSLSLNLQQHRDELFCFICFVWLCSVCAIPLDRKGIQTEFSIPSRPKGWPWFSESELVVLHYNKICLLNHMDGVVVCICLLVNLVFWCSKRTICSILERNTYDFHKSMVYAELPLVLSSSLCCCSVAVLWDCYSTRACSSCYWSASLAFPSLVAVLL